LRRFSASAVATQTASSLRAIGPVKGATAIRRTTCRAKTWTTAPAPASESHAPAASTAIAFSIAAIIAGVLVSAAAAGAGVLAGRSSVRPRAARA
jgi:hypothetical protein